MKIGLNCQHILIDNPAGPERFTLNLYKYLAKIDKSNQYVMYFNAEPKKDLLVDIAPNFSYKVVKSPFLWTQIGLALELIRNPVDVFFTPIHTFPFLRRKDTKFVVMIHGLEYKTNNELNKISLKKVLHPWELSWVARNADKLVVPSQATKNAVINQKWTRDIGKIAVISEGVGEEFSKKAEADVEKVLSRHDLEFKKYLLFISTIQPRKNIVNLIQAFSKSKNNSTNLVLVGKLGWKYDDILSAPKKFGVENNVKFLNWISQEDLPYLLSGASGYINVSFDEGFGLTVLEAMATEIPVVVSDIPAHKEVGGETIKYVNPNSVDEIAAGIALLLNGTDQSLAKERAMNFTWDQTAKKFIELFSSLVHQ